METVNSPAATDCPEIAAPVMPTRGGRRVNAGAPKGNKNRILHGLSGSGFPPGCEHDARIVRQFARSVRKAVVEAKGELSLVDAATVNTAYRWERHARLAAAWLRKEFATLTLDQRLSFSREVARASTERDKALKELAIDSKSRLDPWSVLDLDSAHAADPPTWKPHADQMHETSTSSGQTGTSEGQSSDP